MQQKFIRMTGLVCLLALAFGTAFLSDSQLALSSDPSKYPAVLDVNVDGKTIRHLTYQETLLDAVDEAGIAVGENDRMNLPDATPLAPGQTYHVAIERLNRILLNWNGYAVGTAGGFISMPDLLSRSGFGGLDLSDGSRLEKSMPANQENGEIAIIYVAVDTRIVKQYESIPYSTIIVDDAKLYVGQKVVKTEGQDGQRALIYEETYENGIFMKSVQVGTEVVKEPVQQVIRKGTKPRFVFAPVNRKTMKQDVLNSLAKIKGSLVNNGNKSYTSFTDNGDGTITVDGTTYAYSSMKKRTTVMYDGLEVCLQNGCHDPPVNHNTCVGVPAQRGIVAVTCKRVDGKLVGTALPFGTIIFVEGYGLGVVGDVNGAKSNLDLIDACFDPGEIRAGVATFGKMSARVYILK